MRYRVYVIINPPSTPRYHYVDSVDDAVREANKMINDIPMDTSFVIGLEVYDEELNDWVEYYDEDGNDLMDILRGDDYESSFCL